MKFRLATFATTLLVGLTGGLLHAQAPCNYDSQQFPCNVGQCGPVYLIVAPSHRLKDSSKNCLFGNFFHNDKNHDNCGCDESQHARQHCAQPCNNQPCNNQPCNNQPCYAQPYNNQPCYAQPCNNQPCYAQSNCNENRCNENRCNHPCSAPIQVRVISCAPAYQGPVCPNYNNCCPGYNGQSYAPGYAPGYAMQGAPVTTAEPPQTQVSAYTPLIQAIQAAQERDNRALREMMENRQATQSVVHAIQTSDANTVSTFEKLLQQMKDSSPAQGRDNGK